MSRCKRTWLASIVVHEPMQALLPFFPSLFFPHCRPRANDLPPFFSLACLLVPQGPKAPGSSALSTLAAELEWVWANLRPELQTFGYESMVEAALRMAAAASASPAASPAASPTPAAIVFSIILTVHNMGAHIGQVVEAIFQTTRSAYELIIVYDGCVDDSRVRAEEVVERYGCGGGGVGVGVGVGLASSASPCQRYLAVTTADVFETLANNAGLEQASGQLLALVQDDCLLTEVAWDKRIAEAFASQPNQFAAISGRCAHNDAIKEEYTAQDAEAVARDNPGMRVLVRERRKKAPSSSLLLLS